MADPIYLQIADDLRAQIESGKLKPGQQLETELELRERYAASRYTVRDALRRLTALGLIVTRPGKGTFVVEKIAPFVTTLTGGSERRRQPGLPIPGKPARPGPVPRRSPGRDPGGQHGGRGRAGSARGHPGREPAPEALHRRDTLVDADVLLPDGAGHEGGRISCWPATSRTAR